MYFYVVGFRHTKDISPKFSPKFFSSQKNSKLTHTVISNGGHPLHHQLIQIRGHSGRLQLPLQQNHQVPNHHTVATSLCTVVIPQWPYRPLIFTWSRTRFEPKNIFLMIHFWFWQNFVLLSLGPKSFASHKFCSYPKKTFSTTNENNF